jgi:hypothetical protein
VIILLVLPFQRTGAASFLNLKDEGAVGDGVANDQAAITAAITKARAQGLPLYAPEGIYKHSQTLIVDSVPMYGDGDATVFKATPARGAAIRLTGAGPSLKSVKVTRETAPTIRTAGARGVEITNAAGFILENVTVAAQPGGGIFSGFSSGTAANYASVTNCRVSDTLADGIHMTDTTSYVRISGCTVTNSGDDMFAVVGYTKKANTPPHHIIYDGNTGIGQTWGRGMTCVGGDDITFSNNTVTKTHGAGLLITSDLAFNTFGNNRITATNNTINTSSATSTAGHAGALILGRSGFPTDDVTLDGMTVNNSGYQGIDVRTLSSNVKIRNCTVNKSKSPGIRTAGQDTEISNCYVTDTGDGGTVGHGIVVTSAATGFCKILTNKLSRINNNTTKGQWVIFITSGTTLSSLSITDNTFYTEPASNVGGFINTNGFAGTATLSDNMTVSTPGRTRTSTPNVTPLPAANLRVLDGTEPL